MPCPFIVEDTDLRCSAGQTSYVPCENEAREVCSSEHAENYRKCSRYRRAVWSGLSPTFLDPPKLENGK